MIDFISAHVYHHEIAKYEGPQADPIPRSSLLRMSFKLSSLLKSLEFAKDGDKPGPFCPELCKSDIYFLSLCLLCSKAHGSGGGTAVVAMTAVLVSRNKAPLPGIVNEFENFTKAGVSC